MDKASQNSAGSPTPVSRRGAVAAGLVGLIGGPALAAGEDAGGPAVNPLAIDISGLVIPVASGTTLVNYLFLSARVLAADARSADSIRMNQFMARDAVIRATGRTPALTTGGRSTYQAAPLRATLRAAIQGCMPGLRVADVQLRDGRMMLV